MDDNSSFETVITARVAGLTLIFANFGATAIWHFYLSSAISLPTTSRRSSTGTGNRSASADYSSIHHCFRTLGQTAHRWRAAISVYMCGNIARGYFAGCLTATGSTFTRMPRFSARSISPPNHADLNGDVAANLIRHPVPILLGVLGVLFVPEQNSLSNPFDMALPFFLLQMALLGLGCRHHCLVADHQIPRLTMLVSFGTQLWMYATPVVYPAAMVPEKWQTLYG